VNDPIRSGPPSHIELFEAFAKLADGKNVDAVLGAAVNVIVNAIRQNVALRRDAEAAFDTLFGRAKTILINEHYDAVTGKRRSVLPFTQVIRAAAVIDDDAIRS
jgi:hypothetical protein